MKVRICVGNFFLSNEYANGNIGNLSSFWLLADIMEEVMGVGGLGDSWDLNELLLDVNDGTNA